MAHGVDALRANLDAVSQAPHALPGFSAATAASRTVRSADCDDRMVVLAIHTPSARSFLQRADWQEPFHKHFEQLHKAAILLHGNDQPFVFIAEVLFHELRSLPVAQFTFG